MSGLHPSRLSVEVDRGTDPISGHVYANGERRLPFVGWLGLISALERLITTERPAQLPTSANAHATQAHSPTNQQAES